MTEKEIIDKIALLKNMIFHLKIETFSTQSFLVFHQCFIIRFSVIRFWFAQAFILKKNLSTHNIDKNHFSNLNLQ